MLVGKWMVLMILLVWVLMFISLIVCWLRIGFRFLVLVLSIYSWFWVFISSFCMLMKVVLGFDRLWVLMVWLG